MLSQIILDFVSIATVSARLTDGGTNMKYMLLIYGEEQAWTESERQECFQESAQLCHNLSAKGQYLAASPLQSVTTATSVQIRNGNRLVTDGPFAETREQLGGYFLVDAKNLDEAIEIAGQIPAAKKGTVEIRPVVEVANLPIVEPRALVV
jgi:hypothetical protein